MRIALVGDYPLDPNEIKNGPQAVFTYLVDGLKQIHELELHVVTARKSLDEAFTLKREGVTYHYLRYPRLPSELSFFILKKAVQNTLDHIDPDLVHGQSGHRYGCITLSTGFPTVLTTHNVHGTETKFATETITRLRLRYLFALSRRCFTVNVRYLVSINEYIRQNYQDIVKATVFDIPNPISNEFFELDPDYEIADKVLFVGYLRTRKRPDLALEAFSLAHEQIPNLKLEFAGAAIEPNLIAWMDGFISTHNLNENVRLLGHLNLHQLLKAYQQTSILLLTSDLETSPMAVQQAMAAGKAVVATAVGGIPFLIDNGRNGIVVEPNNPKQIAQALVKLNQNPGLRKKLGKEAREKAITCFKGDVVSRKTYAMYQEILNCHAN